MKDWLVPTVMFICFIYAFCFMIIYAKKIGGPDVPFFVEGEKEFHPKNETEVFLNEITKSLKK